MEILSHLNFGVDGVCSRVLWNALRTLILHGNPFFGGLLAGWWHRCVRRLMTRCNASSSWNIPYWGWFCCLVDILRILLHQGLPFHPGSLVGKSLNITILVGGRLLTFMIHCKPVFWQGPLQIQSFQVSRMLKENRISSISIINNYFPLLLGGWASQCILDLFFFHAILCFVPCCHGTPPLFVICLELVPTKFGKSKLSTSADLTTDFDSLCSVCWMTHPSYSNLSNYSVCLFLREGMDEGPVQNAQEKWCASCLFSWWFSLRILP